MDLEKQAVSIAEMAKMVGLSRGRFYQLVGTTFPPPIYDVRTRRPFYPPDLQAVCLEVRRRNFGIDGRPVLFYARRMVIAPTAPKRATKAAVANNQYDDVLEGLRALGLYDATAAQVGTVMKQLYPSGVGNTDEGEVLRSVFLTLKRRNTPDNLA